MIFLRNSNEDSSNQIQIIYPETKTIFQEDDYHGTVVKDPYRWLEDMESDEVQNWIFEQQSLTESYIDQIPFIDQIVGRISLKIQQLDVMIETKTKDNVFVKLKVSVQFQVVKNKVYDAFYKLGKIY